MGAMTAERLQANGRTVVVIERDKDHGPELDAGERGRGQQQAVGAAQVAFGF